MGGKQLLLLAVWLGIAVSIVASAAQTQESIVQRVDAKFHERLGEHGRVSGDIVMGVMIGSAKPGQVAGDAFADLAPRATADVAVGRLPDRRSSAEGRRFCVRINSKDGRFEAANTYTVADGVSVLGEPFRYDGLHAPVVTAMRAVSLVKVGSCGDRTETVVPSRWAGDVPIVGPKALHIFVNSAGNPTAAVVGVDSGYIECKNVAEPSTLKYTVSCVIPFDILEENEREGRVGITFYVTRSLGEEEFDISVVLPESAP